MGRQQPKIRIASGHGSDPELNISDASWSRIERALRVPLSAEARSGIYEATLTFLFLAGSEQNAEPISAARKTVQRIKESAKNFQGVIFDFTSGVGRDAGLYARHLVNYHCDAKLKEAGGLRSVATQMNLLGTQRRRQEQDWLTLAVCRLRAGAPSLSSGHVPTVHAI
jgi:hypothetical protein